MVVFLVRGGYAKTQFNTWLIKLIREMYSGWSKNAFSH